MASRKLARYRAKRDFRKTAEPSGARGVAPSKHLRFVVQKHAARRLHFDLRLELAGVFKSWAVTRGPSMDPKDKRLAVEVEDHPLDYGDFEGTIPQAEYGGGTVQLWDRGYWAPEGPGSPEQALRAGELKFVLAGERLQGSWVLVRIRHDRSGGKRTNWLLIKHRDEYARPGDGDRVLEEDRSVASGRSMATIESGKGRAPQPFMLARAAGKDLAPDAVWHSNKGQEKSPPAATARPAKEPRKPTRRQAVHRASPSGARRAKRSAAQMPSFIVPQLCKLVASPPGGPGWAHEVKLDGYRLQLQVNGGDVSLKTRKGLDWTERFGALARAAAHLPDCLIDGEVVAMNAHGLTDFSALQTALSNGAADDLVFFAFDLLFLEGEDLRPLALTQRKQALESFLAAHAQELGKRVQYLAHLEVSGENVLASAREAGFEGIVSKRLADPYRSDRGGGWLKSKCRAGQEVVIGGWFAEGGELRSLIVGVYRGGKLVPAGRVGTGFNRANLPLLVRRLEAVAAARSPFHGKVELTGARDVNWVKPVLVAQIEFAGWTDGGSVRQAAYKGLREDKPASEVRAEAPNLVSESGAASDSDAERTTNSKSKSMAKSISKSKPRAKSNSKSTSKYTSRSKSKSTSKSASESSLASGVSNPDKQLWPATGDGPAVTKRDLAEYFERVGEWMLPHLHGRPCSIVRAPDGIDGTRFFQRHAMPGMSDQLNLIKVSGDRRAYVAIDRLEGLVAIAQSAGLELHPGGCWPDEPEIPGRLVFDLDPAPDVGFDAVIDAALELRQRLHAIGLESFCKTTGGKGLHVVTPLARERGPQPDWPVAKAFAREVCRLMCEAAPQRYVLNMAKKERTGRIFLDYLRNDRLSTAVAPLSPRARAGAPVSMPLSWRQVRRGLNPGIYTVSTAPARLRKDAPWSDYAEVAGSLVRAIERLSEKPASVHPADRKRRARSKRPQRGRTRRVASASSGFSGQ